MCLVDGNSNLTTHVSCVFGPLSPFWFLLGLSPLARESRARASKHSSRVSGVLLKRAHGQGRQKNKLVYQVTGGPSADVTLACERCCVTNGYLQKPCVGCKRFFLKEKKNVMFLSKIDLLYCLVVFFVLFARVSGRFEAFSAS